MSGTPKLPHTDRRVKSTDHQVIFFFFPVFSLIYMRDNQFYCIDLFLDLINTLTERKKNIPIGSNWPFFHLRALNNCFIGL